jgi:hypothetical protein
MPVSGGDPLISVIMVAASLRWWVAWFTTWCRSGPSGALRCHALRVPVLHQAAKSPSESPSTNARC